MSSSCNYPVTCSREHSIYIHESNSLRLALLNCPIPVQATLSLKLKICWRCLLGYSNSRRVIPQTEHTISPTPTSSFPFPYFMPQGTALPSTLLRRPETESHSWAPPSSHCTPVNLSSERRCVFTSHLSFSHL